MSNYNFENINYDNSLFYPRDTVNYLIKGTQQSTTNAWKGEFPAGVSSYSDGLTINYYLPQNSNQNAVTLNLSNSGAKPVYLGDSNSQVTNQFSKGSVIRLTYLENIDNGDGTFGGWKVSAYVPGEGITRIDSGDGLTGGPITTATGTGTLKANLNSYIKLQNDSSIVEEQQGRIYSVQLDKSNHLAVNVPWIDSADNIKDDGIQGRIVNHFAICNTSANTAAKTATISTGTVTLENGLRVIVYFTNQNTAAQPTLNINNLGVTPIYYNKNRIGSTNNLETIGLLSGAIELIYYNGVWNIVGNNRIFEIEFTADDIDGTRIRVNRSYSEIQSAINRRDNIMCKYSVVNSSDTFISMNYIADYPSNRILFTSPVLSSGYSLMIIYSSNNLITVNRINTSRVEVVDWTTN